MPTVTDYSSRNWAVKEERGNNIYVMGTNLEPFPKTWKQSSRLKYKSSFVGFILLFSTGELPAAQKTGSKKAN